MSQKRKIFFAILILFIGLYYSCESEQKKIFSDSELMPNPNSLPEKDSTLYIDFGDTLHIESNHIKIPTEITDLKLIGKFNELKFNDSYKFIRKLNLSNNSNYKEIDSSISKLESLEELNLQNTGITSLPEELANIKALKVLKLYGTPLGEEEYRHLKKTKSFSKLLPFFESNPSLKVYVLVPLEYE